MPKKRTFNHGDPESRRRKAHERLGTDNPQCAFCNERDPVALQVHHVGQEQYDASTVIVCLNHHARLSDSQKDHPPKIGDAHDPREDFAHILLGLADLLKLAVEQLIRAAVFLLDLARLSESGRA